MIILYCNKRIYHWLYPYYIADRLGPSECEWIVPGTIV